MPDTDEIARRVSLMSLLILLMVAALGYGFAAERYRLWPYDAIHSVWGIVKPLAMHTELVPEGFPVR